MIVETVVAAKVAVTYMAMATVVGKAATMAVTTAVGKATAMTVTAAVRMSTAVSATMTMSGPSERTRSGED
jgi:hypothetical protein